jgi:hypothetical protein
VAFKSRVNRGLTVSRYSWSISFTGNRHGTRKIARQVVNRFDISTLIADHHQLVNRLRLGCATKASFDLIFLIDSPIFLFHFEPEAQAD